nr:reverse transcriptase domain-containing protein [Tanacetum cinerariifolium]
MTKVVTAATITAATTPITVATITTAPSAARRRKKVVIRDPEENDTPSIIIHSEPKSKDKGKGIMVKEPKPLKKQAQIEQDEAYTRELERKPQTEAQAKKNMMIYLRNMAGFKMYYFKRMNYDDINPIFEKYFNLNVAFLEKSKKHLKEEESRALKRKTKSFEKKAAKKQKLDEKVEELKKHLQIMPNNDDDVYTEATPLALKPQVEQRAITMVDAMVTDKDIKLTDMLKLLKTLLESNRGIRSHDKVNGVSFLVQGIILRKMSAMANTTFIVTTLTKPATNPGRDKTPRDADATPRVNIQDFYEEYYEDIMLIIMEKIRRDKRKEVHARLDFGEGSRERRIRKGSHYSSARTLSVRDRSRHVKRGRDSESLLSRVSESDSRDPEDHVKLFQEAGDLCWAMPKWCHMFNSTLIGAANVWFDELSPESIYSYKDLKAAFLAYFMQQNKYVKDSIEIHNIKKKDRETIEDFMERFKVETERMKGAPECMRISGFMHGVNNLELIKRLNEHVPKTMEEMMITTTAIIRGEATATGKTKGRTSWRTQDQSKPHPLKKRYDFRGQPREGRWFSRFTPLTRTPKEILTAKVEKFQLPPPMVTPVEKRSSNKFFDFHNDKGHSMDELTQSFKRVREITFPSLATSSGTEGSLVIEAKIGGHMIHRMYVDGGSSTEVLYEYCFNWLQSEVKNQMVSTTTSLTGFSGETIWLLGQLRFLVKIGEPDHSTRAWMNFMISVMLGEHNITYRTRMPVKGQVLADFLVEMPNESPPDASVVETQQDPWTLFTDGSSCMDGFGTGLILTNSKGTKFTYALRFQFAASNNEAEYEALIASLRIAPQMGVRNVYVLVEILKEKYIQEKEVTTVVEEDGPTWMTPIIEYLKKRTLPGDRKEASKLRIKLDSTNYWRGFSTGGHGDTPYSLTYGTEAVILAEIRMPTYRTTAVDTVHNDEELRLNLDLLEEGGERTTIREAKAKLKMTKYYNARVRGVTFRPGDFVYHSNDASHAVDGWKLGPKWEGPSEVTKALGDGAYKLRSADKTLLLRTWNVANLEKCYL